MSIEINEPGRIVFDRGWKMEVVEIHGKLEAMIEKTSYNKEDGMYTFSLEPDEEEALYQFLLKRRESRQQSRITAQDPRVAALLDWIEEDPDNLVILFHEVGLLQSEQKDGIETRIRAEIRDMLHQCDRGCSVKHVDAVVERFWKTQEHTPQSTRDNILYLNGSLWEVFHAWFTRNYPRQL